MGVLHDYKCPVHGYFESNVPSCVNEDCQETVMVVFLQAPSIGSETTKKSDKTLNQLAMDFNMTNIKSAREGENQAGYYTRKNTQPTAPVQSQNIKREPRPGDAAVWGGGINGMNMKSVLSGRYGKPVRDEGVGINPKAQGNLTGPRAASYTQDHEGLQIKK